MSGVVHNEQSVWTIVLTNKRSHYAIYAYLQFLLDCCVQVFDLSMVVESLFESSLQVVYFVFGGQIVTTVFPT